MGNVSKAGPGEGIDRPEDIIIEHHEEFETARLFIGWRGTGYTEDTRWLLADEVADQLGVDSDIVEDRWDALPDRLAEEIFRVKDMDTGEVRDLELFDTQRRATMAPFDGDADTR